jgi:glyoxylase-like metal-dependent hydrolase (beta-lactamase superfamily II)
MRVLIDAGMGASHLGPVKKWGLDLLILSHCHMDHRLTIREITDVPVWCHMGEASFISDRSQFFDAIGVQRSGLDLEGLLDISDGLFGVEISHQLHDGDRLDLGGITLEVIHTPGHTPGHLAFYVPEAKLLFTADVDLTSFGPFYGHDFADIDDFLQSIERLRKPNARIVATGHAGPFNGQIIEKLDTYEETIYQRDRLVLEQLTRPMTIRDFSGRNLIFRAYPDPADLIQWFELVHIEKHLVRLKAMGKIRCVDQIWSIK